MSEKVQIVSQSTHLNGQSHRSSYNFTTESFGTCKLEVTITDESGSQELDNVIFSLKADKTGKDSVLNEKVQNGSIISNPSDRNLYIADPEVYGKSGKGITSFLVTFTKQEES